MKFGRLPRAFNPRIPHLSALLMGAKLTAPPPSIDYTQGMPAALGEFGNSSLGDCTCAAVYHALQVWSFNAQGAIDTEPDQNAILLYEGCCGYTPADPKTDQGGVEQDVLTYAMLNGIPMGADGSGRHRLAAFVEVDPRNFDDVKLAIATAGLVYLGFEVPDYLLSSGSTWDVQPSTNYQIDGGHAVVAAGYDATGLKVISWGALYSMTWAFWSEFVDEAYMIADSDFIKATGQTPAGLSLADLETQMAALRMASQ
jgi:hypothetical protein